MLKVILKFLVIATVVACGQAEHQDIVTDSVILSPSINSDGEIITKVANSTSATVISGGSLALITNDPLSRYFDLEIPSGAVSQDATIKIFETPSLVSKVTFGVDLAKAGPSIVIESSDVTDLTQDVTISVPYDNTQLGLVSKELAVIAIHGKEAKIFTKDKLTIEKNKVKLKVRHFGAFQCVMLEAATTVSNSTTVVQEVSFHSVSAVSAAAPAQSPVVAAPQAPAAQVPAATPTPTPTVTPTILEGSYQYEANEANDTNGDGFISASEAMVCNERGTVSIVGNTIRVERTHYTGNCNNNQIGHKDILEASFTLGTTVNGVTPIDLTVTSHTFQINTYNRPIYSVGTKRYSEVKLVNGKPRFAYWDTTDQFGNILQIGWEDFTGESAVTRQRLVPDQHYLNYMYYFPLF